MQYGQGSELRSASGRFEREVSGPKGDRLPKIRGTAVPAAPLPPAPPPPAAPPAAPPMAAPEAPPAAPTTEPTTVAVTAPTTVVATTVVTPVDTDWIRCSIGVAGSSAVLLTRDCESLAPRVVSTGPEPLSAGGVDGGRKGGGGECGGGGE